MQDLNDMLFFAEVAERGSFAAAGRALGLPKSRLSRRVAELEDRLGVRLLHRSTRKLSLTEVGTLYLRHCLAMRSEALAASEVVQRLSVAPRGTVRVTCPVTLAQSVVGALMPGFLLAHPQVRVEMEVSNRVVDPVEEGVDVALRVRLSVQDSASLVVKQLGRSQSVLVASPALLARQGRPLRPQDLQQLDSMAMSALDGRAGVKLQGPDGAEFLWQHHPRYVADDLETLLRAAIDGVGVALLPGYMCREALNANRLVEVLEGWSPPPGIAHAVFTSRRGLVPAVRAFLDHLETGDFH
ncbi:LysR family transcriptional regulator [Pseudorhodoferax sp. Leaf265]|jgi:DNA-binding transcriptional LysR family regulator|uniref:LysR family transcriptional regulator n=1 Tax=Pseudorhodoferax sp. Leaf265 TaxID=1736315 RepID=UPI0006FA6987|nr:LysR family transcriptional regulator [Pseudorhodoferax sp. Leaf265]KQP15893.1 LysR family transcriptional regulator [Pseudorhodoferax sp. Leaf265]